MNKRTLIGIIPAAALLLLTACSQDEPGGQGNELPYGEYPLFAGRTGRTRQRTALRRIPLADRRCHPRCGKQCRTVERRWTADPCGGER